MKLGKQVFISIKSEQHLETWVFGIVVGSGYVADNPDAYWVEVEGLSTRFYSDRVKITATSKKGKKNGE
jgi:hypothetical protein